MTGNGEVISRNNLISVTFSGRGDQTASAYIKIVNISCLQQLMVPLLDSRTLGNLNFCQLSSQQGNDWQ